MEKITTTLEQIKNCELCNRLGFYPILAEELGGEDYYGLTTPLGFDQIIDAVGYTFALATLHAIDRRHYRSLRGFATDLVQRVEDEIGSLNLRDGIRIAKQHADGLVDDDVLYEAWHKMEVMMMRGLVVESTSEKDMAKMIWCLLTPDAAEAARLVAGLFIRTAKSVRDEIDTQISVLNRRLVGSY